MREREHGFEVFYDVVVSIERRHDDRRELARTASLPASRSRSLQRSSAVCRSPRALEKYSCTTVEAVGANNFNLRVSRGTRCAVM
jgi:hypothetical protein